MGYRKGERPWKEASIFYSWSAILRSNLPSLPPYSSGHTDQSHRPISQQERTIQGCEYQDTRPLRGILEAGYHWSHVHLEFHRIHKHTRMHRYVRSCVYLPMRAAQGCNYWGEECWHFFGFLIFLASPRETAVFVPSEPIEYRQFHPGQPNTSQPRMHRNLVYFTGICLHHPVSPCGRLAVCLATHFIKCIVVLTSSKWLLKVESSFTSPQVVFLVPNS